MSKLPATEWIMYGFAITGYLLAFTVGGVVLMYFGLAMIMSTSANPVGSSPEVGIFLGLALLMAGWLLNIAALAGALYKVIVDGVARGIE